uniref:Hypothetical conserved protein n=1 Tax=uncultured prokaryote TaxID=198431 RepID=H5S948_9ZZZZ|nr:hypothetical conserved protein [uncultured prokaryote]
MGKLYQAVVSFFTEDGWHFLEREEDSTVLMTVKGSVTEFQCRAIALEDRQQFIFYSVCPIKVPEERRAAALELIARINYRLVIGSFQINLDDGTVLFVTSIDVENDSLTPALIRNLVGANLATMDKLLPCILSLSFGNCSAQEALASVWQDPQPTEGLPPPSWWARLFDREGQQ